MAIRDFLTNTIGLSHLFMLDDLSRDSGSNGLNTSATLSTGTFVNDPVCEGVTNSYQSTTVSGTTGVANGIVVGNTSDINQGAGIFQEYSIICWFKVPNVDVPTCIYEQGGGTNNKAINVGIAKAITSQSADAGQPFLIAQSNFLTEANRPYFVTHVWQRHTQHAGSGNKIFLYINGVLQEEIEDNGTDAFPNHPGDICIGNSNDTLQSYNGSTQRFNAREKNVNMLGIFSGGSITEIQAREIFERTVKPEVTIQADTVENQQSSLDALIGSSYSGVNCAIRIVQATDSTNYRLFVDNISFEQDENLRDISIQFVGTGVLTLENTNGSNLAEVSTPSEVDLDGTNILTGGGSIIIQEDTTRYLTVQNITGVNTNKIVFESPGSYTVTSSMVNEYENVSGGVVTIITDDNTPLKIETDGAIEYQNAPLTVNINNIESGSSVIILDDSKDTLVYQNNVTSGVFSYTTAVNYAGNIYYAVFKEGFSAYKGSIVVDGSSTTSTLNTVQNEILDTDGTGMYSGGLTSSNLTFNYSSGTITGNVSADITAKVFYDEFQLFLLTEDGLKWIIDNANIQRLSVSAGKQQILIQNNVKVTNQNLAGTLYVEAEVVTQDKPFDVSLMGSVATVSVILTGLPSIQLG